MTLPANITSVIYIQVRMIAAIAHMGGHDLRDDRVKTMVFAALCGTSAMEIFKEAGIQVGAKLAQQLIASLSAETIKAINKAVGFRLLTKFGSTGAINLGKAVPILGGLISGGMDAYSTNTLGDVARDLFIGTPVQAAA